MPGVRDGLGVDDDWYEWMLEGTEGLCEICGKPESVEGRRLAVDHDHVIGTVRGLLCTRCNRKLGALRGRNGIEWLTNAAKYLERTEMNFGDGCPKLCPSSNAPSGVIRTDGNAMTFHYECSACGHHWKCTWRTKGIPLSWRLGA